MSIVRREDRKEKGLVDFVFCVDCSNHGAFSLSNNIVDFQRLVCGRHIRLFLLAVKDPIYELLTDTPKSEVYQFDDAADFSRSFDSVLSDFFNHLRKGY